MITVYLTSKYGSPLTLYIDGSFALWVDPRGATLIGIGGSSEFELKETFDEAAEAIAEARLRLITGGE
jgi:hypothetical protein